MMRISDRDSLDVCEGRSLMSVLKLPGVIFSTAVEVDRDEEATSRGS